MGIGNDNLYGGYRNISGSPRNQAPLDGGDINDNFTPPQQPTARPAQESDNQELLSVLKDVLLRQQETMAEQSQIIRRQHEEITRFENDVVLKSQRGLIMELIGIADQIRYSLEDQKKERDYDTLLDSFHQLLDWVEGSLQLATVRKYEKLDSDDFDPKRQEIVEVEDTSDPSLDGKLKAVLPGYVWQMPLTNSLIGPTDTGKPQSFDFMIRHQQMVKMRYVKPSPDGGQPSASGAKNSDYQQPLAGGMGC